MMYLRIFVLALFVATCLGKPKPQDATGGTTPGAEGTTPGGAEGSPGTGGTTPGGAEGGSPATGGTTPAGAEGSPAPGGSTPGGPEGTGTPGAGTGGTTGAGAEGSPAPGDSTPGGAEGTGTPGAGGEGSAAPGGTTPGGEQGATGGPSPPAPAGGSDSGVGSLHSCQCTRIPSDDGILTLKCKCGQTSGGGGGGGEGGGAKPTPAIEPPPPGPPGTPTPGPDIGTAAPDGESTGGTGGTGEPGGSPTPAVEPPGPGGEGGNGTAGGSTPGGEGLGTGSTAGVTELANATTPSIEELVKAENATGVPIEALTISVGGGGNGTAGGNATAGEGGGAGGNGTGTGAVKGGQLPDESDTCPESQDPLFGDSTVYIACTKRAGDAPKTTAPSYEYLKSPAGTDVIVPGYWAKVTCKTEGITDVFIIKSSAFYTAEASCKELGYEYATPVNSKFSWYWYAFEVCSNIKPHYRKYVEVPGRIWNTYGYQKQDNVAKKSC